MCCSCQDIAYVSLEYSEFIEEYHKFLKYCTQVSQFFVLIDTFKQKGNTEVLSLYIHAVEVHIAATNAYIRLVALYEQLVQKYWNSAHG